MPQGYRHGVRSRIRPASPPPATPYTGVQSYQVGDSTLSLNSSYPAAKLHSLFISWADVERTNNVFTWPANLDASIADAHADNYMITVRVSCGRDSPIADRLNISNTGWMAAFVPYIKTLQNERNPVTEYDRPIVVPVPWDTQHLFYFERFMDAFGARLAGPCPADSSHPRSTHVFMIPAAMPTESGTEMAIGYGQTAATWLESTDGAPPHLQASWTASTPAPGDTFTLTGDVSSIPQPAGGQYVLLRIGGAIGDNAVSAQYASSSELVLLSAFNRSTKVGTIATNGRGWSGTTAVSHTTAQNVYYADDTTTSGSLTTPVTVDGKTGIFDHQAFNRGQWDSLGQTESARRTLMGDAWVSSINVQMDSIPAVRVALAGSSVFRDSLAQAHRVLDTLKTTKDYGTRLICMTTKLAVDPAGTPGIRTYHDWLPNEAAWMDKAATYGHTIGFQTGGLSELANKDLSDATESAIVEYPHLRFIETNFGSRFNSQSITVATRSGAVATFTSNGHGLAVGDKVKVTGMTPSGYNGTWTITAKTTNTFTVTLAGDPGGSGTAFGKWEQAYTFVARSGWPGGTVPLPEYLLTHASNFQDRIPTT